MRPPLPTLPPDPAMAGTIPTGRVMGEMANRTCRVVHALRAGAHPGVIDTAAPTYVTERVEAFVSRPGGAAEWARHRARCAWAIPRHCAEVARDVAWAEAKDEAALAKRRRLDQAAATSAARWAPLGPAAQTRGAAGQAAAAVFAKRLADR